MRYDPEGFRAIFLAGAPLPLELIEGWSLAEIRSDRTRPAFDLVCNKEGSSSFLAFAERRLEGRQSCVDTRTVGLSYYEHDCPVDDGEARLIIDAIAALLRVQEGALEDDALDEAFRVSEGGREGQQSPLLELRINRECNEACLFCNTPPESDAILPGPDAVLALLESERALGHDRVLFTGREPTLDRGLEGYIRRAHELGYREIALQTNGTVIAKKAVLDALVEAGLNTVQTALHTFDEDRFERLIGKRHLLNKTLEGIGHCVAERRLRTEVLFVITAWNLDEIELFAERMTTQFAGVDALTYSPMAPMGWGRERVDLMPQLAEVTPRLAKAIPLALERGVHVTIPARCGLPLCLTPPEFLFCNQEVFSERGQALEERKIRPAPCSGCRFEAICSGVWVDYLDVHGDGELRPVDPALPLAFDPGDLDI